MNAIAYYDMRIFPVFTGIVLTQAAFNREAKRLGVADVGFNKNAWCDATTHYWEHPKHGLTCLVAIDWERAREKTFVQIVGLIAHEVVHVWQQIRDRIGETTPGAETEAYVVQYLTQHFLHFALEYESAVFG